MKKKVEREINENKTYNREINNKKKRERER